jgi:hypothetical protein
MRSSLTQSCSPLPYGSNLAAIGPWIRTGVALSDFCQDLSGAEHVRRGARPVRPDWTTSSVPASNSFWAAVSESRFGSSSAFNLSAGLILSFITTLVLLAGAILDYAGIDAEITSGHRHRVQAEQLADWSNSGHVARF